MIAVVAVAYGSQAPMLGMAEFSPAARQGIEAPPTTAGSDSVRVVGGRKTSLATTTSIPAPSSSVPSGPTAAVPTTRVPRGRQCFGNPPRQTTDPQSPACIPAIFDDNNGGRTSQGVSGTEIRIAVRQPVGTTGEVAMMRDVVQAFFEYANRHFEFYGRRLVPVFVNSQRGSDPASIRAAATDVAATQPFAAMTPYTEWSGSAALAPFYAELARQGIVAVVDGKGRMLSDQTLYDALHPYLWSVFPSAEQLQGNLVDFACAALAGHPARHAGDANLHNQTRKFGVVAAGYYAIPRTRELSAALEECSGSSVPVVQWNVVGEAADVMRTNLARLRDAGVTTLICACEDYSVFTVYRSVGQAAFGPEFLTTTTSTPSDEIDFGGAVAGAPGVGRPFGLAERPKMLPIQGHFWFQALQELSPGLVAPNAATSLWRTYLFAGRAYPQLMVLAAGIQAAGPLLTPETFGQGLMNVQFPNEGAGQAPYWQPSVGFGPGDHSFYNDFALQWWDPAAPKLDPGASAGTGSWCYLGLGERYSVGHYPSDADDRFFNEAPCR